MRITISTTVRLSGCAHERAALGLLAAEFPDGFWCAPDYAEAEFGRGAAAAILRHFPTAAVTDLRVNDPLDYPALAVAFRPAPDSYDPTAWIDGPGGLLVLAPNTMRTAVPNMIRNVCFAVKQRATICVASQAQADDLARHSMRIFTDFTRYARLIVGAPPPDTGLLFSFTSEHQAANGECQNADAEARRVSAPASAPRYHFCFVPAVSGCLAVARALRCSIGPQLFSSAHNAALDYRPVATPFRLLLPDDADRLSIAAAIAKDETRLSIAARLISNTAAASNLILTDLYANATAIADRICHLKPIVVPPPHMVGKLPSPKNVDGIAAPATIIACYAMPPDFFRDLPPCENTYLLAPPTLRDLRRVLEPARRPRARNEMSQSHLYDLVDTRAPRLAAAARARARFVAALPQTATHQTDKRYC